MQVRQAHRRLGPAALLLWGIGLASARLAGQQAQPAARTFTLEEAVNYALAHYPAVLAGRNQIEAARGGVDLARTNYLPQLN